MVANRSGQMRRSKDHIEGGYHRMLLMLLGRSVGDPVDYGRKGADLTGLALHGNRVAASRQLPANRTGDRRKYVI